MKKSVAAIWVFALSLVFLSTVSNAQANTPLLDRNLSLTDLSFLKTPDAIAGYIWKNFLFEKDQRQFGKEDYWQSPEELMKNRKGDCEDFARFALEVLKANGIQGFLMNIYGGNGRYAHTICVFKDGDLYQVIDGDKVKKIDAKSLEEVSEKMYDHWEKAAIVAPTAQNTGMILSQFSKK
jgi:hypothetical protein